MNWVAITVFVTLFALVTVLGFVAGHWRRGDLDFIDEWGLAGRRLGTTALASLIVNLAVIVVLHDATVQMDHQEAIS